jgi:glycerol uptake facilitator-like aquaporin
MPQIPIIIPLIVAGLAAGSAIKSTSRTISKKRLAAASTVAGLLNAVNAYLVDLLTPQQPAFAFRVSATVPATSELPFIVASFLGGFLIVLAVMGIAKAYARTGKEEEEAAGIPEVTSEQERTFSNT